MLNFQVACYKNFKQKMICFCAARKYGMLLLVCKKIRKRIVNTDARSPEIPVFFVRFALFKNAYN